MPHQTDIQEETGVTSAILDHLALHGATPGPGETDHRPLPQPDEVELAMATLFDSQGRRPAPRSTQHHSGKAQSQRKV